MAKSSNGSKEIGGAIDMATHKIILIALPNRTATTTAEALLQHLCHKEGTPLMFHTDAAAELMGRVMTELWRLQGTNATSTLAHHPTGNALCERMWRFVNTAMRCLTDDQYKHWHKHLSGIEAAWNSTNTSTLGMSPFEASTGLPMRTPMLAAGEIRPKHSRKMNASELNMLHSTAAAFRDLAKKNQKWHREQRADMLNRKGRWKTLFKVGDLVKIYLPPSALEAERKGRKAKHCMWYRGPARVIKCLSDTAYTVELCSNKRQYDRSIINVSAWGNTTPATTPDSPAETGAREPTAETALANTDAYNVGDYLGIKDDPEQDTWWLAEVTRVKGEGLHLAYFGTCGKNLPSAKFKPVFVTNTNKLTFKNEQGAARWTGYVSVDGLPGCVVARNLHRNNTGTLSTRSIRVIKSLVNTLSHAVVGAK
jgi:hypothetical protein